MTTTRINNQAVSKEDYQTFLQVLPTFGRVQDGIRDDQHISGAEINRFLDSMGKADGVLRVDDLARIHSKLGAERFGTLKDILKKHKFSVYRECYDFSSWVQQKMAEESPVIEPSTDFLWRDADFVLQAVQSNPFALERADKNFRKDPDCILEGIKVDYRVFALADPSLKRNRKFDLDALKIDGRVLRYLPELKEDEEAVLIAVQSKGEALLFADKSFRAHEDAVRIAMKTAGWLLSIVDPQFHDDPETVNIAYANNRYAGQYASERLRARLKRPRQRDSLASAGEQEVSVNGNGNLAKSSLGKLKNKDLLQMEAFVWRVESVFHGEPSDIQVFNRFGEAVLDFYRFSKRELERSQNRSLVFHLNEKGGATVLASFENNPEDGEGRLRFDNGPFRLLIWSNQTLEIPFKLSPAGAENTEVLKGLLKISQGEVNEGEVFSSSWPVGNTRLTDFYAPYQLWVMLDGQKWINLGEPIEVCRRWEKEVAKHDIIPPGPLE